MFVFYNESVGALKTLLDFTIMANKSCTWGTCPQIVIFPHEKKGGATFFSFFLLQQLHTELIIFLFFI
jgi:hypothetical protein